ncbi:MAG TPA: sulfatase-like hydrolase/transferase [Chloroflexota bacterium]|nr:sulfatase-like hydrolase/transferase [Chloroflexota bacterium]
MSNQADRPNIVFLFADQLRPDFLSCYGADFIQTPHIDSLAEHGVRFTHAYSAHPVCVPARVSLMTGMHAVKTGVLDNGSFLRPDYRECGIETWPEQLGDAGYYTAAIGKMHFYPWDLSLGFQYRRIAEDKRWLHIRDDYYHYLRDSGLRKYHGNEHEGYLEDKGAIVNRLPWEFQPDHYVGMEACRFIQEYGQEGPFAMMVGFPGPHCPYDPAPEFLEGIDPAAMPEPVPDSGDTPELRERNVAGNKAPWNGVDYSDFTREQKLKIRTHYAALVKQIDHEVGAILDALRERNLLENTMIILSADHGDYLGDHNLIGKGHFFESSFHVPLIVRLPRDNETTTPAVRDDLVTLTDVTATLLTLAGLPVPAYMDSRPLPGIGLAGASGREFMIGALSGAWLIYDGTWRLSKYSTGETLLFNVEEDPQEQRNLAQDPDYADVYRRLDAQLTSWMMQAMVHSHSALRVYDRDLSQSTAFGREGWQRTYPRRLGASPAAR